MNDELNIARTEEPDFGAILNAMKQANDVVYAMSAIVTDELAYSSPAFQNAADELRELRAAGEAAVAELDPEVLKLIPADIIAAVRASTSASELAERLGALRQAAEIVMGGNESQLRALHWDHMPHEQRIAQLWHEIDEANKRVDESFASLEASGDLSTEDREFMEMRERERARLDALPKNDPERLRGELELARITRDYADRRYGETGDSRWSDISRNTEIVAENAPRIAEETRSMAEERAVREQVAQDPELALLTDNNALLGALGSPDSPATPDSPSIGNSRV